MRTHKNDWLNEKAMNIFTQYGEDGILKEIFTLIPGDMWCVEFGAYDGKFLSNTHDLITNKSWSGVLIEGSFERFQKLLDTYRDNPRVYPINKFVEFDGPNSLDNLLESTPTPTHFDLLSIDIDGNDYHVWNSLQKYHPKVVVIEFNPSIPNDVEYIQKKDPKLNHSNSLLALYNLGKRKNYELVACTHLNAFFVAKEYFHLFGIEDNRPEVIYTDTSAQTKIFQMYDGTLVLQGCQKLLWHQNFPISQEKIQVLPKYLRKFPDKYNRFEFITSLLYMKKYSLIKALILKKIHRVIRSG